MAYDSTIADGTTGVRAGVDASKNLQTVLPGYNAAGVSFGGGPEQGPSAFSEVDAGTKNGVREVLSAEVDKDYRLRVAHDTSLDHESFNYAAQNTGKHSFTFTTLAASLGVSGLVTNSGSINTTTTGLTFGTNAMFPVGGTQTLVCETAVAFSAQPNANTVIDFGLFQRGVTPAFAPLDGAYFRLTSAGLFGVVNSGGVETPTAVFPLSGGTGTFVYANNATYRFLIQMNNVSTSFWINNYKFGEIVTPVGAGFPCKSSALPWSIRHAIVGGAAGAVLQATVSDYRVLVRGPLYADALSAVGNRIHGSFQGTSGNAMGQLVAGVVTTGTLVKPTAAVPLNASLAANLPNALGGRALEALTTGLAVNTDGILASFTVPAGSSTVPGRRLKVTGIMLASSVQALVVGGPTVNEYYVAFGHTADSLQTVESASMASATTKAPRRLMLPPFTQTVTAAQAASTLLAQPSTMIDFEEPIYVNPGERLALVINRAGTALTAGVLAHSYQFLYSWE